MTQLELAGVEGMQAATNDRARRALRGRAALLGAAAEGRWSVRVTSVWLALFVALTAWTVLIVVYPGVRFHVVLSEARQPLETFAAAAAVLTAGLAYLHYSFTGSRASFFVSLAFVAFAFNRIVFGTAIDVGDAGVTATASVYFWAYGRVFAGALLLLATGDDRWRGDPVPVLQRRFRVALLAELAALSLTHALLFALRAELPRLWLDSSAGGGGGALPGVTPANLALGILGTAVFLAASVRFLRPQHSERWYWLLAPALLLGAFGQLHYMFYPTALGGSITTGDVLRVGFSLLLLIQSGWQLRDVFARERQRADALAGAYGVERTRVEQLEEMERAKAEMSSVLAHELAHPVATLRGFVLTLADRPDDIDPKTFRRIIDRMEVETRRLRDLAEEVVAVAHLERDEFTLATRNERVTELVREAADAVGELEGRLKVLVGPGAETAVVSVDHARMVQIFRNLLSNAEKYADPGSPVTLRADVMNGEVIFAVEDRGAGIPPEDLSKLFQTFTRLHRPGTENVPGSGLGLYITRRIVEAHRGRVWAESTVGRGSTFFVALPRAESSA